MDAIVNWKNGLTFTGTADSGNKLLLSTAVDVESQENGFRPMELFAIGLAGCTAMDVISILSKKRQDVTSFEVKVHLERAQDHPKVFTSAVIEYLVTGHAIDEIALKRAMELSASRYCPAQAMFGKIMPIELKYQIFEDWDVSLPVLVKSGVC